MWTSDSIREERFTFEAGGRAIRAALTVPKDSAPEWGVVIVPGSGPSDVDGNYPDDPMWPGKSHVYADLGRQLAAQGLAVLRYGRGDAVTVDEAKASGARRFGDRTNVVVAALTALRERVPGLKKSAVAGHSEGSVVGSLLLTERDDLGVRAFVSLSGPAWRFYDLMLRQVKTFAKEGILEFGPHKIPVDLYELSVRVARNAEPVPGELKDVAVGFHNMPEDARQYLRDYDAVDNSALIARVPCPVLIVQGGLDGSVFPDNADRLMETRCASPFPTDRADFPDLDHMYKRAELGRPFARLDDQDVDAEVSQRIADWLIALPW
jgi:pimeloyl-ACP methyl ester carboxylesterase